MLKVRRIAHGRAAAFWAALMVLVLAGAAPAAADSGELLRLDLQQPVDVRADRLTYLEEEDSYVAEGEVEVTQGVNHLMADKVKLYNETMTAEAEGQVRYVTPEQVVKAESMVLDMDKGTGKLYNGTIFLKDQHYYLKGEEIAKTGKDTYNVHYGRFTACDGENPDWSFKSEEIDIKVEGYGEARNVSFRVADFPVLWSPYLAFPVKTKRQSGLLPPSIGTSSRDGFIFSQPWFQTLGEDMDATLTVNLMTNRGVDFGGEYRYALDDFSKGMLMADYLPDDSAAQDQYDKGKNAEVYESRWWVRAKADQELYGGAMTLKADIDLVSDQDYLREFDYGYTGFDETNARFLEMFGRDLDPNTSLVRVNQVNLLRSWDSSTFNASLIYYDDLASDNKNTLQNLPTISYDAIRQEVGDTGLYFQMGSVYTYYYRETNSTGSIIDVNPQVSYPMNFNDYVEVEPSFTYMQRFYDVSLNEGEDPDHSQTGSSEHWQFNTDVSTYLYRIFEFGTAENPFKVKHVIRPQIYYTYRPNVEESDIAALASRTVSRTHQVTYGFSNTFTSKSFQEGAATPLYREFMRFNVYHSIDINELQRDKPAGGRDNRPLGLVTARLEFDPAEWLYFESDTGWNPNDSIFEYYNARLEARDARGDAISLDYTYRYNAYRQIIAEFTLALNEQWDLIYRNRSDLEAEEAYENTLEVKYEGQCWGVRAFYTDSFRDRGVFVAFSLRGFGEIFGMGK